MSFDEKAREVADSVLHRKFYFPALVPAISAALKEAVEEENEACAGIADDHGGLSGCEIASAIRSRKEP